MKNSITILCVSVAMIVSIFAFNTPSSSFEYMAFTTVESIVPGGAGRSRMLIDAGDGNLDEQKMRNLYSVVGIKMENIFENDQNVVSTLNELSNEGWELAFTNTGVQSPDEGRNGIYCTRYILRRVK